MIVHQGAVVMTATFVALAWLFRETLRGRGLRMMGPVVAMAPPLNASECVASKTDCLDKLVLMSVCLFPLNQRRPSAAIISGSSVRVPSSIRPMLSNRHQNAHGKPSASALSRTSRI